MANTFLAITPLPTVPAEFERLDAVVIWTMTESGYLYAIASIGTQAASLANHMRGYLRVAPNRDSSASGVGFSPAIATLAAPDPKYTSIEWYFALDRNSEPPVT